MYVVGDSTIILYWQSVVSECTADSASHRVAPGPKQEWRGKEKEAFPAKITFLLAGKIRARNILLMELGATLGPARRREGLEVQATPSSRSSVQSAQEHCPAP